MRNPPLSGFGWFVVIWSGVVSALLTGALQKDVTGTARILFFAAFLFAAIVGIERVRMAVARKQRDREQLKRSAERFGA